MTDGAITELRNKTSTKPYLVSRIKPTQVERFERALDRVTEVIPEIGAPYPQVGVDRKDDYLYAHAVVGRADFLVSGDKGVLNARRIGDVEIVSPAEFLRILKQAELV